MWTKFDISTFLFIIGEMLKTYFLKKDNHDWTHIAYILSNKLINSSPSRPKPTVHIGVLSSLRLHHCRHHISIYFSHTTGPIETKFGSPPHFAWFLFHSEIQNGFLGLLCSNSQILEIDWIETIGIWIKN